ncbi:MAG: preprotein translocase subunit YajC, partial [Paracoccus sp. (in: a-proteobacteria)]|nr:preprotein translocase subunit YajC [Paracoccus sp. (in: a-proteobacteria)]
QKRAKQHRELVANVKKGDTIITQGGILAKIATVRDDELEVEIAQGVRIRVVRSTIAQVVSKTAPVAANN